MLLESVVLEDAPKGFVNKKSLPAKNQKRHLKYLKKKKNKINNATAQHELPKFNQIGEEVEDITAVNESIKSTFNTNYKPKDKLYISEFKDIPLCKQTIQSYKKDCKMLSHIRYNNNIDGCILIDGENKVVGVISIEEKNNGQKWLQALEVTEPYRGHGLSEQLLYLATAHYGARYLSVNKKNEVAIHLYEQFGFATYGETDTMLFMRVGDGQVHEQSLLEMVGNDAKPIFIVNSFTNTPFGKIIKLYTDSKYSHSALSLDSSLDKMYTFNADNKINKFGGVSIESLKSYIDYYNDSVISVKCLFVKEKDFHTIQGVLDHMIAVQDKTTYDFLNILNILFNRAVKTSEDSMTMICSQFVAFILNCADIKLMDKSLNLIIPKDLATVDRVNPKIYSLYEGLGREYNKKKIDRIFKKLKQKAVLIKESSL